MADSKFQVDDMMASSESVSSLPTREYDLADLTVVNYKKLLDKDAAQAALLHSAYAEWGFFYLDLGGNTIEHYRGTVEALYSCRQFDINISRALNGSSKALLVIVFPFNQINVSFKFVKDLVFKCEENVTWSTLEVAK